MTFDEFRAGVLKELDKPFVYKNFKPLLRSITEVGGLDRFAGSMLPLLKACYETGKSVEFTAQRIDTLSGHIGMAAVVNAMEEELDRRT